MRGEVGHGRVPEGYTVCPSCGRLTPSSLPFCTHCGRPLYGVVPVGRAYRWDLFVGFNESGDPEGIRVYDLYHGLGVYGVVGTGKSTFIVRLVREVVSKGYCAIVFDLEGEYAGTLSSHLPVYSTGRKGSGVPLRLDVMTPPPDIPAVDYADWLFSMFVSSIREAGWTLTPQMEYSLQGALVRAVATGASIDKLIDLVESQVKPLAGSSQTVAALTTRLFPFTRTSLRSVLEGPDNVGDPLRGGGVYDLSGLARVSYRYASLAGVFLFHRIVWRLTMLSPGHNAKCIIFVDEGHELIPPGSEAARLARQILAHGRKRGVGLVTVYHSPVHADQALARMMGSVAVFRLEHQLDAREAAGMLGDLSLEERILLLDKGEMFFRPAGPYKARFIRVEPVVDRDDLLALVDSVYKYPYLTSRERKAYLGWNGSRYNRVVEEAVRRRMVEKVRVYIGSGRPVVLLQVPGMVPGAAHRFVEHRLLRELNGRKGVRVVVNRFQGPDLVVERGSLRVAVEIETGTNISMVKFESRLREYDYLVIVCTQRKCKSKVEQMLESSESPERAFVVALNGAVTTILRLLGVKTGG